MRRIAPLIVATGLLVTPSAPAAPSDCTVTSTQALGASPLHVTFTATCASAAYMWNFGDTEEGEGQTVEHVYGPGIWRPTVTTDTGVQAVPPVISISVSLAGPGHARYGQWVALHASVTPRLPVTVRGRRVVGGSIGLPVYDPGPFVAVARGVRSPPLSILVTPALAVRVRATTTVGRPVRVTATLHPARAGTVHVRVDGRPGSVVPAATPHVAHVLVTTTPRPGWEAVRAATSVTVAQPNLTVGSNGPSVVQLQQALAAQHYLVPPRSQTFPAALTDAVYAFQKVNRLARTGIADAATWAALGRSVVARPRDHAPALHVEIDKERQVLFVVKSDAIMQIVPVSTAGLPGRFTPVGRFAIYRKVAGFDPSPLGVLFDPLYFTAGYAIHGNPIVPPYPASHGCVRVPMWAAPILFNELPYGTPVDVY